MDKELFIITVCSGGLAIYFSGRPSKKKCKKISPSDRRRGGLQSIKMPESGTGTTRRFEKLPLLFYFVKGKPASFIASTS